MSGSAALRKVETTRPRTKQKSAKKVVSLPLARERLRDLIVGATEDFWEAIKAGDKDVLRAIHVRARNFETNSQRKQALRLYTEAYSDCFIDGADLNPAEIRPVLKIVEPNTMWEDLFRIVRWTWSMPYSMGYGRRLRFVVWDRKHRAIIGIIGLQSPPVDLAARDDLFNYPTGKKLEYVNRTMDAYTIGAIPPYSNILGGKLVAGLVASNEVRQAYWKAYAGRRTIMENRRIEQPLVAITTTSAFGRSSIYNRLKFEDRLLAKSVGYTKGTGSIHLEALYPNVIDMLRRIDPDLEKGGYGKGPKRKWQHFKRALDLLRISRRYFDHGLKREVFLYRLVENLEAGMSGGNFGRAFSMRAVDYSRFWLQRWGLPRAERDAEWRNFVASEYIRQAIGVEING